MIDVCLTVYVDVVRLFQIATPSTVFVRFSRSLAHMICVSMCKNCGTDFQNFGFKIVGEFLEF